MKDDSSARKMFTHKQQAANNEVVALPIVRKRRLKCNCKTRYEEHASKTSSSASWFGILSRHKWLVNLSAYSTSKHDLTCPVHLSEPVSNTTQVSIGISGALLHWAVQATFACTRGAGGFSISQKLHFPRIVDNYDCTTFFLARMFYDDEESIITDQGDWQALIDLTVKEIECCFRSGEASPHDVTLDGYTLLHVSNHQRV